MRELHGYHGEHRRNSRDAHTQPDNPATQGSGTTDTPRRTALDLLKLSTSLGAKGREEWGRKYQQDVTATESAYAARQAKPDSGDGSERGPERTPPETRDKPTDRIDERTKALDGQREDRRTPERSRLPRNETAQMLGGFGIAISSTADAVNILPGRWEPVITGLIGAAVGTVAWANRRWKDRHGHRPED